MTSKHEPIQPPLPAPHSHNGNGNGHRHSNGNGHSNGYSPRNGNGVKPGHSHSPGNGYSNGNGHNNGHSPQLQRYVPLVPPMPRVVDDGDDFDLNHLLKVLKRRALTFIGVSSLAAVGLGYWHITRPPIYRGGFQLLVEPVTVVNTLDLGNAPFLKDQSGLDYNSQIQVLRSPTVMAPIVKAIQDRYPDMTYEGLLSRLAISRQSDSKLLSISYNGSDPDAIEFILEQLAQGFIQYSVQDRQADLRRGLEFLDQQLTEKSQEVTTIESNLSDLQKQHDLVDINTVSASVTERMSTMLARQEALQVELSSLKTLYDNLLQQVGFSPDAAIRMANLSESPQYQSLLEEYRQIEQQIALESARFQTDTPMIQALEDKRQQIFPLLQEEAERTLGNSTIDPEEVGFQGQVSQALVQQLVDTMNQIYVLQTQNEAISRVTKSLQGEIQYLADLGRSFKQIERELEVAERSFNQLLATRQELRFQMARQNTPWELMTALNEASITPTNNLPRKLVLSTVVGLLLGAAAALLQDKLDKGFHSTKEILDITKLPALATIPYVKGLEQQALVMDSALLSTMGDLMGQRPILINHDTPTAFAFAESFYSLYSNLRLLGSDYPMQAITLTSTQPGEGKSTICAHLAIAATNMGQRVLLIDADMRCPTQHIIFGLKNQMGLSNLLSGNSKTLKPILQTIPGNPKLQILSAGQRPPTPGGLLSSRRMGRMMEVLRQHYDLIIIDTPPLMGITDAKLVSTHTDGMLLATQMGKTPRDKVMHTLTDLGNTIQAPLLGLVVNSVTAHSEDNYYSDYHKSYLSHSTP